MTTPNPASVTPGQVWADNDPRAAGRTLRVLELDGEHAICEVLTNPTTGQIRLDRGDSWHVDTRGKRRRIALRRRTGYRLVREEPPA